MAEMRFSDRVGATQPRNVLQLDGVDDALRNSLWNWVVMRLDTPSTSFWNKALKELQVNFFKGSLDAVPWDEGSCREFLRKWFEKAKWWELYNFIEHFLPNVSYYRGLPAHGESSQKAAVTLNYLLEREMSGFRWIADSLAPITSPAELDAVAQAATSKRGFEGVATHITTAAAHLGKRPDPDYRNSIKESISAVEAAVNLVTGGKGGGVDAALRVLEQRGKLHGALKSAFGSLYGYTSDADGVRHAIMEQQTITFGEAKFMLVVCSAFVNLVLEAAPSTNSR